MNNEQATCLGPRIKNANEQRANEGKRTLSLARLDHFEDLILGHRSHGRQRHSPLAGFLLALLLNRIAEHLRSGR